MKREDTKPQDTKPQDTKPQETKPSMGGSWHRILLKAKYSFYSAVVFFLFANPETLRMLQNVLGGWMTVRDSSGWITLSGIVLTTVMFFFTMLGLMLLPVQ